MRKGITFEGLLSITTLITVIGFIAGWYPKDAEEANFATVFFCIFASFNLFGLIVYIWIKGDREI